ncbi:MAG: RimK family alpha-L-glutamate ligase [Rhodospirillales bacterium]|nr:RimK family alpha-L-glutamate ligase [Alphaproteobacteria bacterium]MCB9977664.1 RimK family alpha-L-glutamate ligase [Rhodospirillales bacterium]
MRIGILTTTQKEEDERLIEEGKAKGHDVIALPLFKCSISACTDDPILYFEGKRVEDFDAIIPRINVSYTDYGTTILRQFQALKYYTTDTAYAIEVGRHKLRCLQHFIRGAIPFPKTGFAYSREDFENIIRTVGGTPIIIKLIEGTEGTGVFLADDIKHAKNILKTFKQLSAPLIIQEFIEESSGNDLRIFVVGDKIVASMERKSQDGDFRANIALGGAGFQVSITPEEEELALKACRTIGINIAGVDIIRSKRGPLVIEINVSPDFCGDQGLEKIAGVNVAGEIIDYAVNGKSRFDQGIDVWMEDKVPYANAG